MKTAFRFLSLILFSASALLHAAERRALVIGNKDYTETGTFADLDTTLNDATVMRTLLGKAGFKLAPAAENLTRIAMMDALIDFRDSLQEGDEAVVYFAGHGLEYQKNVYLMGTNAEGRLKAQLEAEGISEATISATLAEKNIKLAILLLDCCREIPDASWLSADPSTRSRRGGGAAAVTPPPNVIVGYATSGGRFTNDSLSSADRNGPLVAALRNHWDSGEVFELMWKDVAADVFTASQAAVKAGTAGEIQMPSIYGQTVHRFSFMQKGTTPPAQVAKTVPTVPTLPEPLATRSGTPVTATKDAPFTNGLGMKFVPVPIGAGPCKGKTILFSIWETRRIDYGIYAVQNSVDSAWKKQEYKGVQIGHENDHPVVSVSWEDSKSFCNWLTKMDRDARLISDKDKYRLPTDVEWSYAVGIGEKEDASASPEAKNGKLAEVYPWGTVYPPPDKVGNYADSAARAKGTGFGYIEGYNDGYPTTSPVGSYAANRFGIYDLGGNVWEWCEEWIDGEQTFRVFRGGSYADGDKDGDDDSDPLLSSNRYSHKPDRRISHIGFRCVLEVNGNSR